MNGIQLTQNKRNNLLLGTDIFLYNNYWTGITKARIVGIECTLNYMHIVISTEDHNKFC